MTYILILSLIVGNGSSMTTIEFNTKPACEAAAREWFKAFDRNLLFAPIRVALCVEKGPQQ